MPFFKKESSEKKLERIQRHITETKEKLKVVDYVIGRREAEIEAKEKYFETMIAAGREPSTVQKVTHMRKVESLEMLRDFREMIFEELDRMLESVVLGKSLTKAQEDWLKSLDGTVEELVTWRDNERYFDQTAKRIVEDFDRRFKSRTETVEKKEEEKVAKIEIPEKLVLKLEGGFYKVVEPEWFVEKLIEKLGEYAVEIDLRDIFRWLYGTKVEEKFARTPPTVVLEGEEVKEFLQAVYPSLFS